MGCSRLVMCSERFKLLLLVVAALFHRTDCGEAARPRFVGEGTNATVAVGRDAALTCKVDNLQIYKVAWLRVDTQTILSIGAHVITKNHRISVTHGEGAWTLGLRAVGPPDSGHYMCQVNTEPMMSQLHQLQVVVPPDIDDAASSSDVTVIEGEGIALRCVASGTPRPVITWRREDSRHFTVDGLAPVGKWSGAWLNLTAAHRELSGAYLCIASNGVPPSVSKRIQINVMFTPKVWADGVAVRALTGSNVTLRCRADAYPPPQIYWTLNGEQRLFNGTKHMMTSLLKGYSYTLLLTIGNMSLVDTGAYRCHVENGLVRVQAELFLHMMTTTTTTTTTTSTTTTTTTSQPSTTSTITTHNTERELEHLHRGVISDPELENAYVVLSQHQMQNLEMMTTM